MKKEVSNAKKEKKKYCRREKMKRLGRRQRPNG